MNTTSEVKQDVGHAPSQLMASSARSELDHREYGGSPALLGAPSTMAFRPSSIRMPSRSTAFAPCDLEDDDDKW